MITYSRSSLIHVLPQRFELFLSKDADCLDLVTNFVYPPLASTAVFDLALPDQLAIVTGIIFSPSDTIQHQILVKFDSS